MKKLAWSLGHFANRIPLQTLARPVDRRIRRAAAVVFEELEARINFGFVQGGPYDEYLPPTSNGCPEPVLPMPGLGGGGPSYRAGQGGGNSSSGSGQGGGNPSFGPGMGGGPASDFNRNPYPNGPTLAVSPNPIRYFDGMPVINQADLVSEGFGWQWGQARSWTGSNNNSLNGNGWAITALPFISVGGGNNGNYGGTVVGDGTGQRLSVVVGGSTAYTFAIDSTSSYSLWTGERAKLAWETGGSVPILRFTDSNGNNMEFYDVKRDAGDHPLENSLANDFSSKYGRFKKMTAANGTTTIEASYDANGYVQTLTRSDSQTGESERLLYTYSEVTNDLVASGDEATLISGVRLQRPDGQGGWNTIRQVNYSYYTGRTRSGGSWANDPNGRLGDLKLAATCDPATAQNVSSLTRSGTVATVNGHGYSVGDVVVVSGADQNEYDGAFVITAVTTNTFSFTVKDDPATAATGTIAVNRPIDISYYRYYKFIGESWDRTSEGPTNDMNTTGGPDVIDDGLFDPPPPGGPTVDAVVKSGLKTVVQGESFSRLAANYSDFTSATDAQVNTYANNYFEYERWSDHSNSWLSSPSSYDYELDNANFPMVYRLGTRYRVTKEIAQGAGCSTCSGGQGTSLFDYFTNFSSTGAGYGSIDYNTWRVRTTEYLPDSTATWGDNDRKIVYTNEMGQAMMEITADVSENVQTISSIAITGPDSSTVTVTLANHGFNTGDLIAISGVDKYDGTPNANYNGIYSITKVNDNQFSYSISSPGWGGFSTTVQADSNTTASKVLDVWRTYYQYDSNGRLILKADPSAVTDHYESSNDLINDPASPGGNAEGLADGEGRITLLDYGASTTATAGAAGDVAGELKAVKIKRGESGTAITLHTQDYFKHDVSGVLTYPTATSTDYHNDNGTGAQTTSYAYTWFSGSSQIESITTTLPTVSTAQNGPNSAVTGTVFYDTSGRPIWQKDGDGFILHTTYDNATGGVTGHIEDVNTAATSDEPTGWTTPSGGGLHLATSMEVDDLGRTIKLTDPNGNVTYTVYKDADHEVRAYRGWQIATNTTTGPIEVFREYRPLGGASSDQRTVYSEFLTTSATPTTTSNRPDGGETINAGNIQSLQRSITNDAGQMIETDAYFSMAGITYAQADPRLGSSSNNSASGNYHATLNDYDGRGLLKRIQAPTGTITRYLYDARKQLTSTWVGTDDTPTSGYWSPTNTAGTNLVEVSQNQYDDDGNLTKTTLKPGDGPDRVTGYYYDWRDRLVATKEGEQADESTTPEMQRRITYSTLDNLGRTTAVETYDGDNLPVVDTNADGIPDKPSDFYRRSKTDYEYDDQNRLFRTTVHSVDPGTGSATSGGLVSESWFDRRGNVIKTSQPGGMVTKMQYDGAGRVVKTF